MYWLVWFCLLCCVGVLQVRVVFRGWLTVVGFCVIMLFALVGGAIWCMLDVVVLSVEFGLLFVLSLFVWCTLT